MAATIKLDRTKGPTSKGSAAPPSPLTTELKEFIDRVIVPILLRDYLGQQKQIAESAAVGASPERLASLEKAFYTVKRFHAVGAFYNPPADGKVPPTILSSYDKCPTCGLRLEDWDAPRWFSLDELVRMGSRDLGAWERSERLLGRDPQRREGPT